MTGRAPAAAEAAAYFVVSEALTNVARHANAEHAAVIVRSSREHLEVEVRDDGDGGADPTSGSGLRGLAEPCGSAGRIARGREPRRCRHGPTGRHTDPRGAVHPGDPRVKEAAAVPI
jgi:hypothetical protein